MPVTINGNGTITGISAGGLPDGCITADDLASGAGGKILQVVQQEKLDTWSTTSDFVFSDVTGLAVTITPSSSSNKVLVLVDVVASSDYWGTYIKLFRNTTEIGADATGMQSNQNGHFSSIFTNETDSNNNGFTHLHNRQILDSPNTTSAVTYRYQVKAESNEVFLNRAGSNVHRGYSSIILMELTP